MNKTLTVFVVVAMLLAGILFITNIGKIYDASQKDALKIVVSVKDDNITNMTFQQIKLPVFYKSQDSKVSFPEISATARLNNIEAPPVTYWSSKKYVGDGDYELILTFREKNSINATDVMIIPVKIASITGKIVTKSTAFHEWN